MAGPIAANLSAPSSFERLFDQLLVFLIRIGLVRSHFHVLEVRGRKTGKLFSLPVNPLDYYGQRYLVCPRGESSWVKNIRTARDITLVRALRRQSYIASELNADERAPILQAYLDSFAVEVQRFFPVPKGSPIAAFESLALHYPVFKLSPRE